MIDTFLSEWVKKTAEEQNEQLRKLAERFLDDMRKAKEAEEAEEAAPIRTARGGVPEKVVQLAKEMVEFSYREFAKKKHPDQGGSHEEMQLLNAAVAWLRSIIEEKKQ